MGDIPRLSISNGESDRSMRLPNSRREGADNYTARSRRGSTGTIDTPRSSIHSVQSTERKNSNLRNSFNFIPEPPKDHHRRRSSKELLHAEMKIFKDEAAAIQAAKELLEEEEDDTDESSEQKVIESKQCSVAEVAVPSPILGGRRHSHDLSHLSQQGSAKSVGSAASRTGRKEGIMEKITHGIQHGIERIGSKIKITRGDSDANMRTGRSNFAEEASGQEGGFVPWVISARSDQAHTDSATSSGKMPHRLTAKTRGAMMRRGSQG